MSITERKVSLPKNVNRATLSWQGSMRACSWDGEGCGQREENTGLREAQAA